MALMNLILMFLLLGIQFNNFKLVECSATLSKSISLSQLKTLETHVKVYFHNS